MFDRFGQIFQKSGEQSDLLLAVAVIGLVCLLVIPVPPFLLDLFLALSIALSVMVLLLTLYVEDALEFNVFPSLLLFLTLYRLALNIASTRMILTRAEGGDIIRTFGEFVTHGNLFVGLVLFALLSAINFIVLSKGASRIAEVAARFALEAMPGKQMAIDHELQSGILTPNQATLAREELSAASEFYGAMDGASKFVRGDAICSLVITFVNLIGGMVVGYSAKGYGLSQSFQTFSRLTIGDGLVNQLPALLISMGAAIMVTRASKVSLGKVVPLQLLTNPRPIFVSGCVTFLLCFVPGMPILVFLPLSALLFYYCYHLRSKRPTAKEIVKEEVQEEPFVSLMTIELSRELLGVANELKARLPSIRRNFAESLGVTLPRIRIRDQLELPRGHFAIKLKEATLCILAAKDVDQICQKLLETSRQNCAEFLTRQDVAQMVERVKKIDSAVVDELIPARIKIGQLLKVLQNLLRERISIRDFVSVLEALADYLSEEKEININIMTEHVRKALFRSISETLFGKEKIAHAIVLDPNVQQMLSQSNYLKNLRPQTIDKLMQEIVKLHLKATEEGIQPVLLTSMNSRMLLRRLIEQRLPSMAVLSYEELTNEIKVSAIGKIPSDVLI